MLCGKVDSQLSMRDVFRVCRQEQAINMLGIQRCELMSHSDRLADEDNPCFHRNTPVQVLDVVVHKPNTSGSDEMPDSFWRIRAVNEQPRFVQQQRSCAQLTAGTAGCREQRIRVPCIRTRSPPVGPFKLVGDTEEAASLETLLRNPDAVAARRIVGIDQIEKAVFPIDNDRAGNDSCAVEHHLPLQGERQAFACRAAINAGLEVRHNDVFLYARRS